MFEKLIANIGTAANGTWKFFKGKKRYIALAASLLSKITPDHTAVGSGANFITNNLESINIGLEVIAGLFAGAVIIEKTADKLPSGLKKKTEDTK